ncbi:MAG: hypothetical protein ACREMP_04085 [Candidatus Tyrphobacter sp.]
MVRFARRAVALLRWSPHAGLFFLALAIAAHAIGLRWLADIYGDVVFVLTVVAVLVRT